MAIQWLFKDFFIMVAVGLTIVTVIAAIMVRVLRHLVRSFARDEYEKFRSNPDNYVPEERPTAYHGGGAFSVTAVNALAKQFTKIGGMWGTVMMVCVGLMTGVILLAIHQASKRSAPMDVIFLYLPSIIGFFIVALACMVPQKICFTMARWYEEAVNTGIIHPPPGCGRECEVGFPVR